MPSDLATGRTEEIEEERRLLYVAMTRARRQLNLLVPQRFYVTQQRALGERHLYGGLSRFIPPALLHRFETIGGEPQLTPASLAGVSTPALAPRIDLATRLRGAWSSDLPPHAPDA